MNAIKKISSLLLLLICSTATFAQDTVPMADKLREDGKIWVVVAVVAIVFSGIALYMLNIDGRLRKIEEDLNIR